MTWEVRQGDALEVLRSLAPSSVDAVVTDPPYGLSFMGKAWDHGVPGEPFWSEALRVAKPGAHLVAFGGTRTYHRLACAIEDAGWEIRDCLMWLYGSGFPKSLDVSKAIDKAAGAEREIVGPPTPGGKGQGTVLGCITRPPATAPATAWSGWGTALKPAFEPIILARKLLAGTVAANVQQHGTGALNVDGCRIGTVIPRPLLEHTRRNGAIYGAGLEGSRAIGTTDLGRWPANLVLDEEAAALLDAQSGTLSSGTAIGGLHRRSNKTANCYGKFAGQRVEGDVCFGDEGGASRFFYTAKTSSGERHYAGKNTHPTVKPVNLMRWLVRLVTPPAGLVLDPFCGSGSTGIAALAEGFRFLGCDNDSSSVETARRRIAGPLFAEVQA